MAEEQKRGNSEIKKPTQPFGNHIGLWAFKDVTRASGKARHEPARMRLRRKSGERRHAFDRHGPLERTSP